MGEKIQLLRKRESLSQEQLAEQLGVSRQTVSKWELHEATPDTAHIIELSKIFGITTDSLLLEDIAQQAPLDASERALAAETRQAASLRTTCTGALIVGLIVALSAWLDGGQLLFAGIGFLIQIVSVIAFEAKACMLPTSSIRKRLRRRFYLLACWLLPPFPVFFCAQPIARYFISWAGILLSLLIAALVSSLAFFLARKHLLAE